MGFFLTDNYKREVSIMEQWRNDTNLQSKYQVLVEKPVSVSLGSPQILHGIYLGLNPSLVFNRQTYKRPIF